MARLGDVCTIVSGTTPRSGRPEYWDGDINWITPAELTDESDVIFASQRKITRQAVVESGLKSFPAGTVLLSSRAPIGKVAIAGTSMFCNQGFKNLICSDAIFNRYLYHFLKSKTDYLNQLGRGATFKEISKSIVGDVEIPLPPLDEQRRIAAVLDKVSDLIAKRRQQLEKLDELVKARFVEMFGVGTFPSVKLGDVLETTSGGTPLRNHPEFYDGGTIPWLTSGEVGAGYITSTKQFITEAGLKNSSAKWIPKNSIVVAMYGATAGKVGMILLPLTTNQAVCAILPSQNFNPHFLCYAVKAKEAWMMERRTGAAQPNISQSIVRNMSLIVPPLELQNRFASFVQHVEKTKTGITHGLERLEMLKKALMQRYFG